MIFEDLNAFVAVAKLKSFSRASIQLRVAQSSLSKRVQRLEHRFAVELLTRYSTGVSVTLAGSMLLARAESLIDEMKAIERDFCQGLAIPSGKVNIALSPTTSEFLAPRIYEQCRKAFPNVDPQIRVGSTDKIHGWLCSGEYDLALMYDPEIGTDFEIVPLLAEQLFVIAPITDFETGETIVYPESYAIGELAKLPLVLWCRPHSIRVLIERLCAKFGCQPNVVCEIDGIPMAKGMVERGLGFAISGYAGLKYEIDSGKLRAIPFSSSLLNWKLCMVLPRRNQVSLAVDAIKGIVERQVDEMLANGSWGSAKRIRTL